MPTFPAQIGVRNHRQITIGICIFLTALIWVVFGQTLRHDFVNFDDDVYVYQNPHVSAGLTLEGLSWLLTHSHASLWHPLTTLSHMLDCQIYGLKAGGHHFTNVILHNIAAVLLFLVFRAMTGQTWRSAFVAAIFAIHPMRAESVAWIAERKDVLSGVFLMLTLWAYLRYTRTPGLARYLTLSIFVACGLMSKAMFVMVPLVLLLLDYWPLNRGHRSEVSGHKPQRASWPQLILEKIPLLILSAAASVATTIAQRPTIASLQQLALLPRLKNAAVSLVIYLRQMFWPTDLAIFYPHPHDHLNVWVVLGSVALIVTVTLVAFFLRQRCPYILFGWLWYLLLVFPVLGLVQAGLQARADRFTYLPHIGISILVTWTVADLVQHLRIPRAVPISAAALVIAASTALAYKQTTYWHDSISIWQHALAVTSDNQTAHKNLAAALYVQGRIVESRKESRASAIAHAKTVLQDFPDDIPTRDELGVLLLQSGEPRNAIAQWQTSLQLDSEDGNALNNLAWVLATYPANEIRDGKRAVELAEKATTLQGGNVPLVLRTLAASYAEAGDFAKAIETMQHAIDLASAQNNGGLVATLQHELELYRAGKAYRESPPQ
jgi:protein O-mannosyl-transferase